MSKWCKLCRGYIVHRALECGRNDVCERGRRVLSKVCDVIEVLGTLVGVGAIWAFAFWWAQ